jgi:nucleoside-diphosphate-sugar epimerase
MAAQVAGALAGRKLRGHLGDDMTQTPAFLWCFGLGYTAETLARRLAARGWRVAGTSRDPARRSELAAAGIEAVPFDTPPPADVTHLLASAAPTEDGDPALIAHGDRLPRVRWAGVLSTTGVYGDHGGGWVDETTPPAPRHARSRRRVAQEEAWRATGLAVQIFRLAGIYGPGRSVFDDIRAGRARRVDKPGQVFSRIHVDDIATVLEASIARPESGAVYNVADDAPGPSHAVIAEACGLIGVPPPPLVPFDPTTLSPMAAEFYAENRRVRNERIKRDLAVRLAYPTFREGLRAILAAEQERGEIG